MLEQLPARFPTLTGVINPTLPLRSDDYFLQAAAVTEL